MRQSLQSKFNLLGLLLIAFFLLMLPMFSQVKDDTRQSMREWKSTAGAKWTNEIMKDFKPPEDLENTQVEDYWDDYQEQAREANPECPACNPESDADGDNITNKDELEQGRNPNCHEEQLGQEYCQNADPYNITDPEDVLDRVPRIEILNATVNAPCGGLFVAGPCSFGGFELNDTQKFSRLEAYLNVSDYQGVDWRVDILGGSGEWEETGDWSDQQRPQTYNGYGRPTGTSIMLAPEFDSYEAALASNGATQGEWHLVVYGIR